jgi:hypothetical protein
MPGNGISGAARALGVHERVDEQRQAGGDRDRAREVEVTDAFGARLGQQARREQRGGDAHRHVHEQHPLPAGPLREHAAEQDADRTAGAGDRAPHAHGLVALGALREEHGHERERGGRQQRGAEALDGPSSDQLAFGLREPAGQRGEREEHEPAHEQPASTEQVGHAPAEEQEAAEHQHVGVDDP